MEKNDDVNGIMAQKVAPNSNPNSLAEPVISGKSKNAVRATFDQMRFKSEVAPKIILKYLHLSSIII